MISDVEPSESIELNGGIDPMQWEDPERAMKMRHSREEYCQRLLTSLILAAPDPGWNKQRTPSRQGRRFLSKLFERTTGEQLRDNTVLVNEFSLPGKVPGAADRSPDYGVLTDSQLWIIELKTEKGSHRQGQLPEYEALGHFHYPDRELHLLYLTPEMHRVEPDRFQLSRFAHFFWNEITGLIADTWAGSPHEEERRLCAALTQELSDLATPPKIFRDRRDLIGSALTAATEVQATGRQSGVEVRASGLEDLMRVRSLIAKALARSEDAPNVKPWIWYADTSGGKPLTDLGALTGCELRLSRYKTA